MATSAQALEDFCLAYRAMLTAARRVRMAVRAEVAGGAILPPVRIDTHDVRVIQRVVAEHYGLTVAELVGPRRYIDVAHPRLVAMELCASLTTHRREAIGTCFNRHHTMVKYAVRAVRDWRDSAPRFAGQYATVRAAATKAIEALDAQSAALPKAS